MASATSPFTPWLTKLHFILRLLSRLIWRSCWTTTRSRRSHTRRCQGNSSSCAPEEARNVSRSCQSLSTLIAIDAIHRMLIPPNVGCFLFHQLVQLQGVCWQNRAAEGVGADERGAGGGHQGGFLQHHILAHFDRHVAAGHGNTNVRHSSRGHSIP